MYHIDTEGDTLVCAAISGTGECLAFGGSGGYVHLWATSAEPSVNQMRQVSTAGRPAGGGHAAATAAAMACRAVPCLH